MVQQAALFGLVDRGCCQAELIGGCVRLGCRVLGAAGGGRCNRYRGHSALEFIVACGRQLISLARGCLCSLPENGFGVISFD